MGKVWSLDFLSIHNNAAKNDQYIAFIGSHLPKTHIQDKPTKKFLQEQPKVGHGPRKYIYIYPGSPTTIFYRLVSEPPLF